MYGMYVYFIHYTSTKFATTSPGRRKAEVKKTGGAVIPLSDVLNVFSLADDSVVHRN